MKGREGRDWAERGERRVGETEIKRETEGVGGGNRRARLNQVSPKCRERRWSDSQPLGQAENWKLFLCNSPSRCLSERSRISSDYNYHFKCEKLSCEALRNQSIIEDSFQGIS